MKLKFFTSLTLLCMFGAGALAQTTQTATKYKVEMNSETADADKWTAKVGSADAQDLPVEAAEGDAVTVIYSGTKNVKSVKAVKVDDAIDLSKVTADLTLQNGNVVTGTLKADVKISIAPGATVTLRNVNITAGTNSGSYSWAGLNCLGDATIILADGTTNTVKGFHENYPGIHVLADYTLTIQGTGTLNASSNGFGCGIGGGYVLSAGNIVIEGGSITATGGEGAAAIGSGQNSGCGNITISGGTVVANGGAEAAGIGPGNCASCGNITITDTVTSVTATKSGEDADTIGAGYYSSCGTVTIGGVVGAISESPYTYTPEQN